MPIALFEMSSRSVRRKRANCSIRVILEGELSVGEPSVHGEPSAKGKPSSEGCRQL